MAFNFKEKEREFKKLKKELPRRLGNIAVNHYKNSFREGGFTDEVFEPWKPRTSRDRSDRRNPNKRRAILVKTGHLRRSIKIGSANFDRITVGSYGLSYAKYHNRGAGRLPERKFIGESRVVTKKIKKLILKEVLKTLE